MGTNFPEQSKGAYLPPNNGTNLFRHVTKVLSGADAAAANLEGTLLDFGGKVKEVEDTTLLYACLLYTSLDSISAATIKDSIDAKFEPVYHRIDTLGTNMIATYAKRLNTTSGLHITASQKAALLNEIRSIYNSGIVDQTAYADISAGKMNSVRMLSNNVTAVSYTHLDVYKRQR